MLPWRVDDVCAFNGVVEEDWDFKHMNKNAIITPIIIMELKKPVDSFLLL